MCRCSFLLLVTAIILKPLALRAEPLTVPQTQIQTVIAPGFDHVPVKIPVSLPTGAAAADLQVVSDLAWAVPTVEEGGTVSVQFHTRDLLASATATLTISHGADSVSVFVSANVKPLNVYRLLDDPYRNLTYGIQADGINEGAVFTYDPLAGTKGACLTVGKRPTDFVISDDGSELLVICSADKSISVVDLATFSLKETIALPSYDSWGSAGDTTANIDLGAGDIIYYTDGSWGPVMRVYNRVTKQVIQSLRFDGGAPANATGFMDFAVTSNRTKIVAMPQYGWSAGSHSSIIAHYSIAADGTLAYLGASTVTTGLAREPFEAPALITENDQTVFMKTIAVSSQDINDIQKNFAGAVWSISPGGEWVATATDIYDYTTGNKLLTIPGATSSSSGYTGTKAQAFTSDYSRFVYFNPNNRSLNSLDLVSLIGPGPDGQSFNPVPGSVITAPQKLSWAPRLGISSHHLYLGTSDHAVNVATPASPEFLGMVSGTRYESASLPTAPGTYYWRLDPISPVGPQKGSVYSFTVSPISLDRTVIKLRNVTGAGVLQDSLLLGSPLAGENWSASSNRDWITFETSTGSSPATLSVLFNTENLAAGVHLGTITLTTGAGELSIPVELSLDAMNLTVIKSDPASSKVYAISENTATPGSKAYLLEIDSATESILRVAEVGTSATDFSLHRHDGKIYVTNWQAGALLAVDRETFQVTRTYAFSAFGGIGYGSNDVFRVSSGGPGRLVVEEMDQWVDISIFNTNTGTKVADAYVREGGGAFDSTGRYYYHGENNSSGASIIRYDVTGDVFTPLTEVRPEGLSYYGSRTVVISENNQRIFWANVALNAALVSEWAVGEPIYSCTADGRFAFAENKIYDVNRRLHVLGMPVTTRVSAFNSTTSKLVTQTAGSLRFNSLTLPLSLTTPTFVRSEWTGSSLVIEWSENSLETGFHLQSRISGGSTWTDVNTAIGQNLTSLTVTGLSDSASYEFRIRAIAPETSSSWSEILSVDLSQLPPAAPSLHAASAVSPYRINLAWSLYGSNTQVIVERASEGADDWLVIATLPAATTSFAHEGLQPSTTHRYRVKAVKTSASSSYSNILTATTSALTAPSAPGFISATASGPYRINLAWSNVSLASSYRIERKLAAEGVWNFLVDVHQGTFNHVDTTVAPGTNYSYRLFSVNAAGPSGSSATRSVTTPEVPWPTEPYNLIGQAYDSQRISLAWSDSEHESGYRVQRNIAEGEWQTIAELPAETTYYLDSGLTHGVYYNYRVIALNSVGAEAPSMEVNVLAAIVGALLEDDFDPALSANAWSSVVGGSPVSGQQGFHAGNALWFGAGGARHAATVPVDLTNGGTLLFKFRAGNQEADGMLHWNNSEVNEHVMLEYSNAGGAWQLLAVLETLYPNHETWTSYSITLPLEVRSDATRFRWRQASNSGVALDTWALDDFEIRSVLSAPPAAPDFIIANANSARAAAIYWSPSDFATYYVIQRRTPSTAWTAIGSSPSHATYFTDQTVLPLTAYSYRVLAGNSNGVSDPSLHAFVTTWSIIQEWRFQNYGTIAASGTAADMADNGSGVANLLKFAFNMSKDDRSFTVDRDDTKGLPFITLDEGRLQVAFVRRRDAAAAGIRYIVDFSSDLGQWEAAGSEVHTRPIDDEFDYVIWRDSAAQADSGNRFARVRVERTD